MKKYAVMLWLVAMGVGAFASDITINDENSTGSGWWSAREDQEVEPNCDANQSWDLEAFKQDGNSLSMIGGYNFAKKTGFTGGDIFIAVDDPPLYGAANSGSNVGSRYGNSIITNNFGYDYAIRLTFNQFEGGKCVGGSYIVYSIDKASTVEVYYSDNAESNPWKYNADGTVETTGTFTYQTGLSNSASGYTGGLHNKIGGIDLSFIGSDEEFWAHYTMQCGNDNLMGHGNSLSVPEPGSLILFGTGLLGLLGLAIARRKK